MKSFDKLGLYSHILPAATAIKTKGGESTYDYIMRTGKSSWESQFDLEPLIEAAKAELYEEMALTVFDCRSLPLEFVEDAGSARLEEIEQTRDEIKLPRTSSYFEFKDFGVFAWSTEICEAHKPLTDEIIAGDMDDGDVDDDDNKYTIYAHGFENWRGVSLEKFTSDLMPAFVELYFGDGDRFGLDEDSKSKIFNPINVLGPDDTVRVEKAVHLLLGTLMLLNEKLIVERVVPDDAPKLSAARRKRGNLPVSGSRHILTINVPAMRRIARATPLGSHESPALHWRRGHTRVLHRGSEFENKAWVRMCLVGDPNRGFVGKSYRLVRGDLPMLVPTEPRSPEALGA